MITVADLPINPRGAVYHLDLLHDELADIVITVGDPGRVSMVSKFFDSIEIQRAHREFKTHTGYLGKKRITVLSTGMGTPNIDIALNELDAIANIDLATRTIKQNSRKLKIVRLGTSGGLDEHCSPGDIAISRYAFGFDTLINYYQHSLSEELIQMEQELASSLDLTSGPFYAAASCPVLAKHFSSLGEMGITATCGGFYGPQGRELRVPLRYPSLIEKLRRIKVNDLPFINMEMETAAIYGLGTMLEHQCLSISLLISNRAKGSFITDIQSSMEELIVKSLALIEQLP